MSEIRESLRAAAYDASGDLDRPFEACDNLHVRAQDLALRMFRRVAVLVLSVLLVSTATAASIPDLHDGGDLHEGVGQGDTKALQQGTTYQASKFALPVRIRPPDANWEGLQLESGAYRFVQLHHLRTGTTPLHGVGYITLEAATVATPSVAAAITRLRATPHMQAGATTRTRVAGFAGQQFDATIIGSDLSGTCPGGNACPKVVSLAPFLTNHHCGFCGDSKFQPRETHDVKEASQGQRLRIIALDVRGKTVIVYIEPLGDPPKFPTSKIFPTFLPYAQKMLAALSFS